LLWVYYERAREEDDEVVREKAGRSGVMLCCVVLCYENGKRR
jgi:hypothetical protein